MRIFVTGATGYIGGAVASRLARAGHEIVGLTRSASKAARLRARGIEPVVADLRDVDSYRRQAQACEAMIHCAFEYGAKGPEADRAAVRALLDAAEASGKPRQVVYTSGVWVLGSAGVSPADETAPPAPPPVVAWRPEHERLVLEAGWGKLSAAVVRPGCVYGGGRGLYGAMLESLFTTRRILLAGGGANRWAPVYLDDLAELYRLVVEKRPAREIYHAVDGSEEPVRAFAEAAADAAGGGVVEGLPLAEARRAHGPIADALAMDQRVSAAKARAELGWKPAMVSPAGHAAALLAQWHETVGPLSVA